MRRSVAAAIGLLACGALGRRSLAPPAVAPERGRALLAAHAALFDDVPRPTGSPAAAAVRDRIRAALGEAGCPAEVRAAWTCHEGRCARVENLWCRLGPSAGAAVVGLAHTDSVPAGPGAADDGAGVLAWVEAVRVLAREPLARPFVLVLTDGEELGLLGARAWFADPGWQGPVDAVVNLEARGTRGAAFLFETVGPARPWGRWAAALGLPPRANALYPAVYDRLPNDTDLSVVRAHGLPGVNHAFLGELPHYHTRRDDRAHLDPASLAHEVDLALAWVRRLQDPPEGPPTVFADQAGLFLLQWPVVWTLPLSVGAALGALGWTVTDLRAGRVDVAGLARAALAALGAVVVAGALAEALGALVSLAGPVAWAHPERVTLATVALVAAVWAPSGAVGTPWSRWSVAVGSLAAAGVALAALEPRLTPLTLPPALAAVAGRALFVRTGTGALAAALPAFALAWLPLVSGLPEAVGVSHPAVVAVPLSVALLGASPFAPARPWRPAAALLALAGLGAVWAALGGPATPDRPLPVNHVWTESSAGASLRRVPLLQGAVTEEPRPSTGLPGPGFRWLDGLTLALVPARGGHLRIESVTPFVIEGHAADGPITTVWGIPAEGTVLRFVARPPGVVVREVTSGLPPGVEGAGPLETPAHGGDRTEVAVRAR